MATAADGRPGRPVGPLAAYRDRHVPDLLPDDVRLLVVGINPSLWTAATGAHFARPGNRFYPTLFAAGLVDRVIDASAGYAPQDRAHLLARGIGVTNLVPRATARADELTREELRAGADRLARLVTDVAPRVVAVAGITAYRQAFARPKARLGRQAETVEGVPLFVVPNPSGLNAHASVASLAEAYRAVGVAAGLVTAAEPGRSAPER